VKITIFTLFPEMFPGPLNDSIAGKALEDKKWQLETINIRDFSEDKHNNVDDKSFGGGTGLVIRPDVLSKAIDSSYGDKTKLIYMTPRGKPLNQQKVEELAKESELHIICGRYEGIDQRILEEYDVEEISIGDYVLSGGEIPALVLIDACVRQLDGVIGNALALEEESFVDGLLEYPHYTKPSEWRGKTVPDVLLSGNHAEIEKWRKAKSEEITAERRPDLWKEYKD
jgi:tRNA (guanine37-N1)-methyltransferase